MSALIITQMSKAQDFKDGAVGRMISRKPMPTGKPARDPRVSGIKNPAGRGEQQTQLEKRVQGNMANNGPTTGGYKQQSGPGMLPK